MIICTYKNRRNPKGRRSETSWPDLVKHLSRPIVTPESMAEYSAMDGNRQGEVKDVGGFVGGDMRDGVRHGENLINRSLIVLDADHARTDDWDAFISLYAADTGELYNVCVYPTHSYTPEAPHLRWVFPLTRPVNADEYRILATMLAHWVGIDGVDECTAEPERLMYWPSCSRDFDYPTYFRAETNGVTLDPDVLLASAEAEDAKRNLLRRSRPDGGAPRANSGTGSSGNFSYIPDIIDENRNITLTGIAGKLRRTGMNEGEIYAALTEVNYNRCTEPLPDDEVATIARSIGRRPTGDPGLLTAIYRGTPESDFADLGLAMSNPPEEMMDTYHSLGLGDATVAHLVRAAVGDQFLYNPMTGNIMRWTGTRYVDDDSGAERYLMNWVVQTRRRLLELAKRANAAAEKAEDYADESGAMEAKRRAADCETLYKFLGAYLDHNPRTHAMSDWKTLMTEPVERFDADPFLLNTPDGIVNLRTGETLPCDMQYRCTKITRCGPGEKGKQMWAACLHDITGGNAELEYYLKVVFGLIPIGAVRYEAMFVLYGGGGNGKSTVTNAVQTIMADYAGGLQNQTLLSDRRGNTYNDIATLRGERMAVVAELEENAVLSPSQVKLLTSSDQIRGEVKFKDPCNFTPSHTIVLYSNHLPRVPSSDRGTRRRIRVIPFMVSQEGKGEIKNYAERLVEDAGPAIMQWLVEGAKEIDRLGYQLPACEVADNITQEYLATENPLPRFLSEECLIGENEKQRCSELVIAYNRWAKDMRETPFTARRITLEMAGLGYQKIRRRSGEYWVGVRLRNMNDDLVDAAADEKEERSKG